MFLPEFFTVKHDHFYKLNFFSKFVASCPIKHDNIWTLVWWYHMQRLWHMNLEMLGEVSLLCIVSATWRTVETFNVEVTQHVVLQFVPTTKRFIAHVTHMLFDPCVHLQKNINKLLIYDNMRKICHLGKLIMYTWHNNSIMFADHTLTYLQNCRTNIKSVLGIECVFNFSLHFHLKYFSSDKYVVTYKWVKYEMT